jgi:hypothetical protein
MTQISDDRYPSNHGRSIASIHFPDDGKTNPNYCAGPSRELRYIVEYHGDHEVGWVIELRDGLEVARFNARFIQSIVWDLRAQAKPGDGQ